MKASDEIAQLKEEISSLVDEKEDLSIRSSKLEGSLENVSKLLETAHNDMVVLKVCGYVVNGYEDSRLI